jgi:hypothetical protein
MIIDSGSFAIGFTAGVLVMIGMYLWAVRKIVP